MCKCRNSNLRNTNGVSPSPCLHTRASELICPRGVRAATCTAKMGDYDGLKVVELKKELDSRGLSKTGRKADLVRVMSTLATAACATSLHMHMHGNTASGTRSARAPRACPKTVHKTRCIGVCQVAHGASGVTGTRGNAGRRPAPCSSADGHAGTAVSVPGATPLPLHCV